MESDIKLLRLPVRPEFVISDERLYADPEYVQDVLVSGMKVVREKEAVDAKAIMEGRHKVLLDKYQREQDELKKAFIRREADLTALCEEREQTIQRKTQEVQRLQQGVKEAEMASFERGHAMGKKENTELLDEKRQAIQEVRVDLKERMLEIERLRNQHKDEMDRLRAEKDAELEHLRNESNRALHTELANLNRSVSKFQGNECTSTEIGKVGEAFVGRILDQEFNPCLLTVTAEKEHSADLLFETDGVHIRIEVKNKQKLDRFKDLQKFHDDVKNHAQEGYRYSAALFVQLKDTPLIDGHKTVFYETRHGMPVIYIGDVYNAGRILLSAAVRLLVKLARSGMYHNEVERDESSEEEIEVMYQAALAEHRKTALSYLLNLYNQEKDIRQDKKLCEDRMVVLYEREQRLKKSSQRQLDLLNAFPSLEEELKTLVDPTVGGTRDVLTKEVVVEWLREMYFSSGYNVTQGAFVEMVKKDKKVTVTATQIRQMGGMNQLKTEARKLDEA